MSDLSGIRRVRRRRRQAYAVVFFIDGTLVTESIGPFYSLEAAQRVIARIDTVADDYDWYAHPTPQIVPMWTIQEGLARVREIAG